MNGAPLERPALLALDLDGTVVEPRRPIRPAVVRAVREAVAAGVHATLVTGRIVESARRFAEVLGIDAPLVCYQGAVIADPRSGEFLEEKPLTKTVALRCYHAAKAAGLHIQFYVDDRFVVEERNAYADLYARTSEIEPVVVPSLAALLEDRVTTKLTVVTDPERALAAYELLLAIAGERGHVTRSNPEFVDVLDSGVDKGAALRRVCTMLGIEPARCLAIGDSYNDLALFAVAGRAIAMGSAPDALKERAYAVVADVASDGVAEAIDRYVLNSPVS